MLCFTSLLFSQDEIKPLKLQIQTNRTIAKEPDKHESERKYRDSLNTALLNDNHCMSLFAEYSDLCCEVQYKIWEAEEIVRVLNEEAKNSGYYYVLDCHFYDDFDIGYCSKYLIGRVFSGHQTGTDVSIRIVKKEKSVFNEDGTSGETLYYNSIKPMPRSEHYFIHQKF
jgi:hypothetical protein